MPSTTQLASNAGYLLHQGDQLHYGAVAAVGNPPQSRVSNHLACLRWCELVTSEKVGRNVLYRLVDRPAMSLIELACDVVASPADHLASCPRIGPEWI